MSAEYSQGIMTGVGPAILKDGVPMTVDEIVAELNSLQAARAQGGQGAEAIGVIAHTSDPRGDNPRAFVKWLFGGDETNLPNGTELYTQPQPAVPEGWTVRLQEDGRIYFSAPSGARGSVKRRLPKDDEPISDSTLDRAFFDLCSDLLSTPTTPQHPDDAAVDRFAAAMKAKLAKKRGEGRGGWEDEQVCPPGMLQQMLLDHLRKGDPVDIGNFAMMIWDRGEAVTSPTTPQADGWVRCEQVNALFELAYIVDGLVLSESEGNQGDAKEWRRHISNWLDKHDWVEWKRPQPPAGQEGEGDGHEEQVL